MTKGKNKAFSRRAIRRAEKVAIRRDPDRLPTRKGATLGNAARRGYGVGIIG